jgi:hypothetical protein
MKKIKKVGDVPAFFILRNLIDAAGKQVKRHTGAVSRRVKTRLFRLASGFRVKPGMTGILVFMAGSGSIRMPGIHPPASCQTHAKQEPLAFPGQFAGYPQNEYYRLARALQQPRSNRTGPRAGHDVGNDQFDAQQSIDGSGGARTGPARYRERACGGPDPERKRRRARRCNRRSESWQFKRDRWRRRGSQCQGRPGRSGGARKKASPRR